MRQHIENHPMKKTIEFFKNTIITGLVILVPIAVIIVLLADTVKKLIVVTTPISSKLAFGGPITKTAIALLFVAVIIVLILLMVGLLMKSYFGKSFQNGWTETFLKRFQCTQRLKEL